MNLLCSYLFVMLGDRCEMLGIELLKITLYVFGDFVKNFVIFICDGWTRLTVSTPSQDRIFLLVVNCWLETMFVLKHSFN